MNRDTLDKLTELWTDDPAFRRAVREDPQAAVAAHGIVLTEEDKAVLQGIDVAALTDQELEPGSASTTAEHAPLG